MPIWPRFKAFFLPFRGASKRERVRGCTVTSELHHTANAVLTANVVGRRAEHEDAALPDKAMQVSQVMLIFGLPEKTRLLLARCS